MGDIKQIIRQYIDLDDRISDLNSQVKVLKSEKGELDEQIKNYMLEHGITKVDLPSGNLRLSKSKVSKKVNKTVVIDTLLGSLEEDKAHSIIENLYNDDTPEEIIKLERKKK